MPTLTFVTTSRSGSGYNWTIPEYTGRRSRGQTVWVKTVTAPIVSASTIFTQNGEPLLQYVSGVPTQSVGSAGGTIRVIFETNVDSLQTEYEYRGDSCPLTYVGSNIIGGGTITSSSRSDVDRKVETITFTGDPGMTSSFQLCVTYSYEANSNAYPVYGTVTAYSGSVTIGTLHLTQSSGTGTISVDKSAINVTPKGGTGSIIVTTNDSDWTLESSEVQYTNPAPVDNGEGNE